MATEQPTEAPTEQPTEVPAPTSTSTSMSSAAQTGLLQAALGAPAGRMPVSRLSEVVPRESMRDLVATIRAYREAAGAPGEQGRAAYLLAQLHDQADGIAWPAPAAPPASSPVLVVLPDAAGLAELLRLAVNAGDRDVHGPGVAPFPPLHELAADHEDRLVLEAAARHLHPLITSLVFADTDTDTNTDTTDHAAEHATGVDEADNADSAERSSAERSA